MKFLSKLITILILAAAPIAAQAQSEQGPEGATDVPELTAADLNAWLDGFVPYAIGTADVAGAVVTVVKDGEILANRGFGFADVKAGTPVDPDATLFRPGSISKLFTWTAVMQLVEQGKLDLDADISVYLDFEVPAPRGTITLRHLMTHTPGFEETVRDLFVSNQVIEDDALKAYLLDHIPAQIFDPGTIPSYSNYGSSLAGYIVERISGEPFTSYVENHIFAPLGMTRSSFRQPLPDEMEALMSKGYRTRSDGKAKDYEIVVPMPAGALAATGSDLALFMNAHLNQGAGLMRPETAALMHGSLDNQFPPLNGAALGFYRMDKNGLNIVSHGGDTAWFHSDLYLLLDHGIGLYISLNSSGGDRGGNIRRHLYSGFVDRYFPQEMEEASTIETAKEHGKAVAGVYEVARGGESSILAAMRYASQMEVTVDDEGAITMPFVRDMALNLSKMREVAPWVWQAPSGQRVVARVDEAGNVTALSSEPVLIALTPVPWHRSSAWLTPALIASLIVLGFTFLAWPIRAIARKRMGVAFALAGDEKRAYRLAPVSALLTLVFLTGWGVFFSWLGASIYNLEAEKSALSLVLLYASSLLPLLALAASLWAARVKFAENNGWGTKLNAVFLVLAIMTIIWVAAVCGLFTFNMNF